MNQLERDKEAVLTVLNQQGECHMADVLLHGGEGLCDAVWTLVRLGEIDRIQYPDEQSPRYRLKQ